MRPLARCTVIAALIGGVLGTFAATPALADTASFSNGAAIAIPDSGDAAPYPSPIEVAGLPTETSKVTVTLLGFSHSCPNDVNVLLAGPSGAKTILFAGLGPGMSCLPSVNADLGFDEAAPGPVPYPPASGTYRPTEETDPGSFDAPAPAAPYPATLAAFDGTDPNGSWSLYVNDSSPGDSGSFSGGWSLTVSAAEPPPPAKDPKCARLERKLRLQRRGLRRAGSSRKRAVIRRNSEDTKRRQRRLAC